MSPAFIPSIKELAHHLTVPMAKQLLAKAMQLNTTRKISNMLNKELLMIAPNLHPILMR